jgi:hypothetical protein
VVSEVSTNRLFSYTPTQPGPFTWVARAEVYDAFHLEWGPVFSGVATNAPVSLSMDGPPVVKGGNLEMSLHVTNWVAGMQLTVLSAAEPNGAWAPVPSATVEPLILGTVARFRAVVPCGPSPAAFYQVRALPPASP